MTEGDGALVELLRELQRLGYDFIPPTPRTHARVLANMHADRLPGLRDIFGWSLPFSRPALPSSLFDLLRQAEALKSLGQAWQTQFRVARVGEHLYLHSAYPTDAKNAVFLGPDSYRFARFLEHETRSGPTGRLLDMGAGAGVGGIHLASALPVSACLADSNPVALRLARINAAAAGVAVATFETHGFAQVPGSYDLIVANPPFLVDPKRRAYRDGGGTTGAQMTQDWVLAASQRLSPGGRALIYSASAIIDGRDHLHLALTQAMAEGGCLLEYFEIDPDIFGEELANDAYRDAERIAAVGIVIGTPGS